MTINPQIRRISSASARPPRGVVLRQPPVENTTEWSVSAVRTTIQQHEQGDFAGSSNLIEAMGRDDRISGCLRTRVNALVGKNGVDFCIQPAKDDGSSELAARVEAWWFDALPDDVMRGIVKDMVMAGVALGRITWALSEREWIPVGIEHWHLQNYHWDESHRCYMAHVQDGPDIPVLPGDPNWLLITPEGHRSWMGGGVRALGMAYVMRQFNWRDWARFNERHGLPIIAIKEPVGFDKRDKDSFYGSVKKMGSTGVLRLPFNEDGGFDLSMIEAKDRGFDTFTSFRKDLDIAIAVTLLGQNLTSEATGGSLALGRVHDRIRQDYLECDTEVLATALRAQIIVPWGRFNARTWNDKLAPWPYWETGVPTDRKEEAETLNTVATAVKTLQTTGFPVDYDELFTRVGVPVIAGRKANDTKPPAPQPAPGALPDPGSKQPTNRVRLQSGDSVPATAGIIGGQTYVDELADGSTGKAGEAIRPFLDKLLDLVDSGSDYEEIRAAVLKEYEGRVSPARLREILQRTLVLADLAGEASATQDE